MRVFPALISVVTVPLLGKKIDFAVIGMLKSMVRMTGFGLYDWRGWALREIAIEGAGMGK